MQQPQQDPLFSAATELERERMMLVVTRRQLYHVQQSNLELLAQHNEHVANALVATIKARIEAAAKAEAEKKAAETPLADLPAPPTGDAQVVELRASGPVPVGAAA